MGMRRRYPIATVAILGGGQLGRMLIYEALRLGIATRVLDPVSDAPCARIADTFIRGALDDERAIRDVATSSDVLTWEIEHVGVEALDSLSRDGVLVQPRPDVLRIIQDKLAQKQFLKDRGLPVPRFSEVPEKPGALEATAARFGYPCVQKSRFGGYDGRGVAVLRSAADLGEGPAGPAMVEELVEIETEVAVIVARSTTGESAVYPVVDMTFDETANICSMVSCPSRVNQSVQEEARGIAREAVAALDVTGVAAVELFVTHDGRVLINEIAPRPHNSGHLTIEACRVSQFQQHLRAILGLPLGDPTLVQPAAMVNIVGMPASERGPAVVDGLEDALGVDGASVHLYGKVEARPHRKMGHVTVTAGTRDEAIRRAERIQRTLRIFGGTNADG